MANSKGANVLITGASDGIGLALARIFAERGARTLLVGRRAAPPLPAGAAYCRADLAQPAAAALVAEFLRRQGVNTIDLLIHCAGVGFYGPVTEQSDASVDELLAVNLRAPLALTQALLPPLKAARGRVVFIGSVAAALPAPDYAVYAATKAALEGFARSLRVELRGQVEVQIIHPGATRTSMHARSGAPLERIGWRRFPPPERVAGQIARAVDGDRPLVTVGAGNCLLGFAGRHLAGLVDRAALMRREPGDPGLAPVASRHCVITGGADGIGFAVAERFAAAGYAITLVDVDASLAERRCGELRARGAAAHRVVADLSDIDGVTAALVGLGGLPPADVVVYSAGISAVGRFGELDLARQQAVLDLNLRAPMLLTAGLLARGRIAAGGTLVFIASLSVFTGYPGAAAYAASKDGLAAYARSLRVALAPQGLNVLTVFPGPTRTAHARRYSPDNRRERRRMPPARLAGELLAAVCARRATLVPGATNRLMALAGRLLPQVTEELMRRAIFEKLASSDVAS